MAQRQLYTGGIGSQSSGEAFTSDYDLPNDTVYAESCAFHRPDDVRPANAGNGRRQSICRCDGARAVQHRARRHGAGWQTFLLCESAGSTSKIAEIQPSADHVKPIRQRWFGCACCPPNIARVLASMVIIFYTPREDALYINIYAETAWNPQVENGTLRLRVSGNYEWQEQVTIAVESPQPVRHTLALRLPDWCTQPQIILNGEEVSRIFVKGICTLPRMAGGRYAESDFADAGTPRLR